MMIPDSTRNIITRYFSLKGIRMDLKDPVHSEIFKRSVREAKVVYRMAGEDIAVAYQKMQEIATWANDRQLDWSLSTVVKRWLEKNTDRTRVTTNENWKDELEPEKPRDQTKIDQGLQGIRDLLKKIKP